MPRHVVRDADKEIQDTSVSETRLAVVKVVRPEIAIPELFSARSDRQRWSDACRRRVDGWRADRCSALAYIPSAARRSRSSQGRSPGLPTTKETDRDHTRAAQTDPVWLDAADSGAYGAVDGVYGAAHLIKALFAEVQSLEARLADRTGWPGTPSEQSQAVTS